MCLIAEKFTAIGRTALILKIGKPFPSVFGVFESPFLTDSASWSTLAHTHPCGNAGKPVVSGCTGSGYFFCQSLGGVLPCSANLASCLASQRARRSVRMRVSSCAPVSDGVFLARQSAVSAPSTAAFRSRASALGHHMGSSPSTRTRSSSDHAVALRFMRKLILPFFPIGTGRTKFSTIFFNNDRFCGA